MVLHYLLMLHFNFKVKIETFVVQCFLFLIVFYARNKYKMKIIFKENFSIVTTTHDNKYMLTNTYSNTNMLTGFLCPSICVGLLDVKPGFEAQARHQNKIREKYFFGDFLSADFWQKLCVTK